jgi:DNA-binding protein H-NS
MEDLSKYSLSQLKKIQTEVEEELKKRHFLSVSQAREQILHIARGTGLSMDDLISGRHSKGSKEPLAAKYRHPEDSEKQWSGRGRMPFWVKDWIESGRDLAETKV